MVLFESFPRVKRAQAMARRTEQIAMTLLLAAKAKGILDKARDVLPQAAKGEQERFRNVELGLEHGRLLAEALRDGKTSNGAEGQALLAFRRQVASRNVINVYWTTSKEKRYGVFD